MTFYSNVMPKRFGQGKPKPTLVEELRRTVGVRQVGWQDRWFTLGEDGYLRVKEKQ